MGIFERYLTYWVGLCIVAGVGLGYLFPAVFSLVASWEYAHVNLLIAVLFG
jgi:ACR3 family arsenite transporter